MAQLKTSAVSPRPLRPFWETVWPPLSPNDTESSRRRKLAVRAGQIAMLFMIGTAAGAAPLAFPADFQPAELLSLALVGLIYIGWNLIGTQGVVTLTLWDHSEPAPLELLRPRGGEFVYFTIQLSLAAFICAMADHGRVPSLVWLVLLPPVAFAVFIMEWRGILIVSGLVLAILVGCYYQRHGLHTAIYGGLAFSFAVVFTVVFAMLAVQAEKSRNEVQRLAAELSAANRQLREYAVQVEELSTSRERNRIAREIHDSLGHYLTVASIQLEAARELWKTTPDRAYEAILKAQAFTREGLQDVRRSVASLRNAPLDDKSLTEALTELTAAGGTGPLKIELVIQGLPRKLAPPVELSLYRATQEGLNNVRKHAQAKSVKISLDYQETNQVRLWVTDDGQGASRQTPTAGFGLRGLQERALLLGGSLVAESQSGHGFVLKFEVPA